MQARVEDLEVQALKLAPEDRARLLERLIASFEPQSETQITWLSLASRRRDDAKAGRVSMVPGAEALERIRAKLA